MTPKVDFLQEGFETYVKIFCEEKKCGVPRIHLVRLLKVEDGFVHFIKACDNCYVANEELKKLGIESEFNYTHKKMAIINWIYLMTNPNYLD